MKRIIIALLITFTVGTFSATAHASIRTSISRLIPKLRMLKGSLPNFYWYQAGIKTGLKFGILTGVAASPGVKLYPEKKTIKERYALVKQEAQEQTILFKEHIINLIGKIKPHQRDIHMIVCHPK